MTPTGAANGAPRADADSRSGQTMQGTREPGPDVVVAGLICLDIIPSFLGVPGAAKDIFIPGKLRIVGPAAVATGGVVANTGLALHKLGAHVRMVGKVGADVLGKAIMEYLSEHGKGASIALAVDPKVTTSYSVVISPPGMDRMFWHHPGANDTFSIDDVPEGALSPARLFHFGYPPSMSGMFRDNGRALREILDRVKGAGVTTSLDMAFPDPDSDAGRTDWAALLRHTLPVTDIFLPSFDELLFMIDRPEYERVSRLAEGRNPARQGSPSLLRRMADEMIRQGAALVAIKLGDQGLYLRTTPDPMRLARMGRGAPRDPERWLDRELLIPCFEVGVVGTTGSGDCTIAGFLFGLLNGLGPEETVLMAVAVGACCVEAPDATSGVRTWDATRQRVRLGWKQREVELPLQGWTHDLGSRVWRSPRDTESLSTRPKTP